MSIDALNSKLVKVQNALNNPEVKFLISILDEIAANRLRNDFEAKGEEAVRALGFQQGIGVIKVLPQKIMADIAYANKFKGTTGPKQ